MATILFICTGCGRDLEVPTGMVGKRAVCPQCQAVTEVPTEVEQTRRCPFCSEVIMASAQKCRYCGERMQVPTVPAHAASPMEQLASATQSSRPTYQYRQATAPAGWTYGASSGRTRSHMKPYGAVSLVMIGAAMVLFFVPWINLVIVKLTPFNFVRAAGEGLTSLAGEHPDRQEPDRDSSPSTEAPTAKEATIGIGGLMLVACPFIYGGGLVMGVIGGFTILGRWHSRLAFAGLLTCAVGCCFAIAGWHMITSAIGEAAVPVLMSTADIGLTGWCYLALVVSILGTAASSMALRGVRGTQY